MFLWLYESIAINFMLSKRITDFNYSNIKYICKIFCLGNSRLSIVKENRNKWLSLRRISGMLMRSLSFDLSFVKDLWSIPTLQACSNPQELLYSDDLISITKMSVIAPQLGEQKWTWAWRKCIFKDMLHLSWWYLCRSVVINWV